MKEGQCSLFTTKLILMRLEYSLHWKIEKKKAITHHMTLQLPPMNHYSHSVSAVTC